MIFFLLIWAINTLGFIALASSMSKHQKQFFNHELSTSQTKLATSVGWILLIMALILSLLPNTISNGISYWVGVLTFSALFVGLTLSYFAHKIKMIIIILLITTLFTAVMTTI
jgi:hypothetical protein